MEIEGGFIVYSWGVWEDKDELVIEPCKIWDWTWCMILL